MKFSSLHSPGVCSTASSWFGLLFKNMQFDVSVCAFARRETKTKTDEKKPKRREVCRLFGTLHKIGYNFCYRYILYKGVLATTGKGEYKKCLKQHRPLFGDPL